MNGPPRSPTTQDPTLRTLVERGFAHAKAREAASATIEPVAPAKERAAPPPRALGLASDRGCVETNLARKGLWRSGSTRGAGGGELVRLLDATDQLGLVQRIDAGPPLGSLAFDVIVWVCSRWREQGEVGERHVPLTLEAMATDLGWRKGGGAAMELARALDTLRSATFRARVYNARLGETRIDTFGLLDRWERGERHQSGRPARPGFVVPTSAGQSCARCEAAPLGGSWCTSTRNGSRAGPGDGPSTVRSSPRWGSERRARFTSGPPCGAPPRRSPAPRTATSASPWSSVNTAASTCSPPFVGSPAITRAVPTGEVQAIEQGRSCDEEALRSPRIARRQRDDGCP